MRGALVLRLDGLQSNVAHQVFVDQKDAGHLDEADDHLVEHPGQKQGEIGHPLDQMEPVGIHADVHKKGHREHGEDDISKTHVGFFEEPSVEGSGHKGAEGETREKSADGKHEKAHHVGDGGHHRSEQRSEIHAGHRQGQKPKAHSKERRGDGEKTGGDNGQGDKKPPIHKSKSTIGFQSNTSNGC